MDKKIACVIPARGGSKGIPHKNIVNFCGKSLLAWSVIQAIEAKYINSGVYVSSDDEEILKIGEDSGAIRIKRPDKISGDEATSESALMHALNYIEERQGQLDYLVFLQATSPLRKPEDIDNAVEVLLKEEADSVFSATELNDLCTWKVNSEGNWVSSNYNFNERKRRQDTTGQVIENGSIYVFRPKILRSNNNRLGGKISVSMMEDWQVYEIDSQNDLEICKFLFRKKLLEK